MGKIEVVALMVISDVMRYGAAQLCVDGKEISYACLKSEKESQYRIVLHCINKLFEKYPEKVNSILIYQTTPMGFENPKGSKNKALLDNIAKTTKKAKILTETNFERCNQLKDLINDKIEEIEFDIMFYEAVGKVKPAPAFKQPEPKSAFEKSKPTSAPIKLPIVKSVSNAQNTSYRAEIPPTIPTDNKVYEYIKEIGQEELLEFLECFSQLTSKQQGLILGCMRSYCNDNAKLATDERARRKKRA
jgi:hypothetical protein